jgi:hypothetical protein
MIIAVNKTNWADADTYVVCLDCGHQFIYDLKTMRVGPRVAAFPASGVLDSDLPLNKNTLRYAVIASLAPLMWATSRLLRKSNRGPKAGRIERSLVHNMSVNREVMPREMPREGIREYRSSKSGG